jgi:riboflavin kinase/FMN adenylyltransferase
LRPSFKPQYVTSLEDRIRLISELGVDLVVPVTFDLELSKVRTQDFLLLLQQHLRMRGLVVGPDFAMGHSREGDVEALTALGREMGFSVSVVELLVEGDHVIRSTSVRAALAQGDVTRVAELLGRNFTLAGKVAKGKGRGRILGFPTVNLEIPSGLAIPANGIYATWARLDQGVYMAATSIGTRPTFDETEQTVEAFILDFKGDLYDRLVQLEFVRRLRDELKYDAVEALQEQVSKDVDQTRTVLRSFG